MCSLSMCSMVGVYLRDGHSEAEIIHRDPTCQLKSRTIGRTDSSRIPDKNRDLVYYRCRLFVIVLDRTRDLEGRSRQSDVGFIRAAAGLLAIATVTISHEKRIRGTFVAHLPAKAASGKFHSHSFLPPVRRKLLGPLSTMFRKTMIVPPGFTTGCLLSGCELSSQNKPESRKSNVSYLGENLNSYLGARRRHRGGLLPMRRSLRCLRQGSNFCRHCR